MLRHVSSSYCTTLLAKHRTFLQFVSQRCYQEDVKAYLSKSPTQHSQLECETFWSSIWQKSGLFRKELQSLESKKPSFTMLLPPPNITGALHIGHALTVAIEDALIRFHRMNGHPVRWYGGTDHAGIATQMIIENKLWAEQRKTRHDVTRQEFYQIFESWKEERVKEIEAQLGSLGACIDHGENYFTLSPEMSGIVNDAFIALFHRGLIQRRQSMVNWSYYLQSTLSDIEIEHKFISKPTMYQVPGLEHQFLLGVLHTFRYPLVDSNETVDISTTRIESLMGDVALCVNPNDERNRHLIGRSALNPFTHQPMPILADDVVKPDFGTGVLKLTPAHSVVDYEIAQRHNLPSVKIFDDQGRIDCAYPAFNGVHRYAAKEMVCQELQRLGLYCGHVNHPHWLPVCSRSGDIIESRLMSQWFLEADQARFTAEFVANRDNLSPSSLEKWNELRQNLSEEDRNIAIIPSGYRNVWKDWFSRYKDWCISRQIFYGHRIPAYQILDHHKGPTDLWVVGRDKQEAFGNAQTKYPEINWNEAHLEQDTDVLDTWFSSGLLPLAVTGMLQDETSKRLSLMETGHDIIFFWVARMVLLSLLTTGRLPFDRVLLHGMICDAQGKKMSKSRGNVVNPLHVIRGAPFEELVAQFQHSLRSGVISEQLYHELVNKTTKTLGKGIPECGADILRLSLLQTHFKNQKVNFDLSKTLKKRVFSNKMHNTVRFINLHLNESCTQPLNIEELGTLDRWILNRFTQLVNVCRTSFESYDLQYAANKLEKFWIKDLCDVYLENIKADQRNGQESSMKVLVFIAKQTLLLLHPFMPFLSESLYQQIEWNLSKISNKEYVYTSILLQQFPNVEDDPVLKNVDTSYQPEIDKILAIVSKIRWFRQHFFINKDPILSDIRVACICHGMEKHANVIEKLVNSAGRIQFTNLYDVYSHEHCYIAQVEMDDHRSAKPDEDGDDLKDSNQNSNSLKHNEIFVLFTIDKHKLMAKWRDSKQPLSTSKMQQLLEQLEQLHSSRFTENYKRITKLIT